MPDASVPELERKIHAILSSSSVLKKGRGFNLFRETKLIMQDALKLSSHDLLLNPEITPSPAQEKEALEAAKRRAEGFSLACIFGYRDFYEHRFLVNSSVLVPRPETEQAVEICLAAINTPAISSKIEHHIVDCGTGSGCIGISIAAALPKNSNWQLSLCDYDEHALEIAKRNAERILGKRSQNLNIYQDSLIERLLKEKTSGKAGIIVANLPYVCPHELNFINTVGEPHSALTDFSSTGIRSIETLIAQSAALDYPHLLILEYDPLQLDSIVRILGHSNKHHIHILHDLAKKPRYITCKNFK